MSFPDLFWGEGRSHFFGCLWEPNHSGSFRVSIDLVHVQSYTNVRGDARVGTGLPRQGCARRHQQLPAPPGCICPSCDSSETHLQSLLLCPMSEWGHFYPRTAFSFVNLVSSGLRACCLLLEAYFR